MKFLRFIVYGNVLVSLSVGSITYGISSIKSLPEAFLYAMCAALATLFIYNLQRLMRFDDVVSQSSDRHIWLIHNKWVVTALTSIGGGGAMLTYLILGIHRDIYLVAALTVVGILYAYQGSRNLALRDLPFLKIYIIGIVWTMVGGVWPILRSGNWKESTVFLMISLFLYIVAATIPFDIRDLIYDDKKQKTIPQLIGERGSKITSVILLLGSATILIYLDKAFLYNPLFYVAYLGMIILVTFVSQERKEMYFSGLIDGWIIFLGLLFAYQAYL